MRAFVIVPLLAMLLPTAPAPLEPGDAWIIYDGDVDGAAAVAEAAGLRVYRLHHLDMAIIGASPPSIAALMDRFDVRAKPDWTEPLHLDESVTYIGAPLVQGAVGNARNGPTVLVIDTGVSSTHPDFRGGNLAANVGTSLTGGVVDSILDDIPIIDPSGHGTHVAGIVAGTGDGLVDSRTGPFRGVYSNGRVASFQASVQTEDEVVVSGQAILAGFDWALANQDRYNIRVISNSWGSSGDLDPDDPIERATLRLYLAGMTVIFSAGNEGTADSLNRHCTAPWSLCVAGGDQGTLGDYSSRGDPRKPYAHPDLTAPGTRIRAPTPLEDVDAFGFTSGDREALYADRTGTSMAAPHVAGVAALILALNPDLSPDQVMDVLVASTQPMDEPVHEAGTGFLIATSAATLASQQEGNLDRFLSGHSVKYAGALTGDPANAVDSVSSGIEGIPGRPTLIAKAGDFWQEAFVLPTGIALAALVLTGSLLGVVLWRRY